MTAQKKNTSEIAEHPSREVFNPILSIYIRCDTQPIKADIKVVCIKPNLGQADFALYWTDEVHWPTSTTGMRAVLVQQGSCWRSSTQVHARARFMQLFPWRHASRPKFVTRSSRCLSKERRRGANKVVRRRKGWGNREQAGWTEYCRLVKFRKTFITGQGSELEWKSRMKHSKGASCVNRCAISPPAAYQWQRDRVYRGCKAENTAAGPINQSVSSRSHYTPATDNWWFTGKWEWARDQ